MLMSATLKGVKASAIGRPRKVAVWHIPVLCPSRWSSPFDAQPFADPAYAGDKPTAATITRSPKCENLLIRRALPCSRSGDSSSAFLI
jgi:hypothetical protein